MISLRRSSVATALQDGDRDCRRWNDVIVTPFIRESMQFCTTFSSYLNSDVTSSQAPGGKIVLRRPFLFPLPSLPYPSPLPPHPFSPRVRRHIATSSLHETMNAMKSGNVA